jgi:hypothetical protein
MSHRNKCSVAMGMILACILLTSSTSGQPIGTHGCRVYCASLEQWLGPQTCSQGEECCITADCTTGEWAGACCGAGLNCAYGVDSEGNKIAFCIAED